jgi:hypothetical protein
LHLHGHWDQPSSVVLGIRAYDAMLGQDLAQHVQRALASFQSLAFIGCGATLEDPNFGALLAWMREQLTGLEHSHYLLLREGETLSVPEPQLREARIVPLRYGRTHTDLLPYLHDLLPEPTGPTPDPRIGRSKPSPPSVPPIDRRAYAEQARKRYDVLDLTALTQAGSVDPEAPPPRLSRLFVPPQSLPRDYLLSQGLDPDDEERARDLLRAHWERTERGPVLDLIGQDRARCAVVLGDPGAGKSSLVRYLLLRLLEFPATDADAAAAAWRRPLEGRLPFLVELRDLIAREAEGKCADFLSYLAYLGERQGLGFARAQLEHALGNGPTLVVFDGLDEIFEVKPRSRIANEIIGFAARWPSARVLVTSRIAGFHAHPFEAAGFAVLTLDDLDDAQVRVFATAWFELVFPGQPREAERAWQDRLETLTHRPNLRVLAGNPLLLTIMAVVARHERLARSRAKLYEQALKVLCYGYAVAEADLHHALEGYFLDHWGFERATQRRAAREMIELLETRNWILTLRGPRLYGFVHRTFLEYLCAAELVRRFQDRELEFEELRDRHVLGHVEDDAWHEVIRLLVALLPLKQAEEIVRVLTPAPERAKEREACLVLAFQCLAEREGRELGRLAEACDRLMDALYAWLPQLGGYDHWEREQRLSRTVAQSLQAIGSGWPDMALLEKRGLPSCGGIYDDRYLDPFVALVGLFADLPATRELLTSRTLAEEGSARGSALRALAAHFRDDPETAPLLRHQP